MVNPTTPDHGGIGAPVRELDIDRCLDMLATHQVGRLAVDDGRGPVVLPVNYHLDGGTVLIRTAPGTKLDAADRPALVCFEIDEVDEVTGTGWSVVVRGRLIEVIDPDELERILGTSPVPYAGGDHEHVIQLLPTAMSGRVLLLRSVWPTHGRHPDTNTWLGQDGDDLLG